MQISRPRFWPRLALGTLVLLAMVSFAYAPLFRPGAEFIWDDDQYVAENPELDRVGGLRRIWSEPTASPQYYPLVFTSYRLERILFGTEPRGHHLTNVFLHFLAAILLWRIGSALGCPAPWLGAALFLAHPLQVETVAWITERKNTLSFVLAAGATLAWIHFRLRHTERLSWPAYALSLALFSGALTAKTVVSVVPVVWLLILWGRRSLRRQDVLWTAPFLWLGVRQGLLTARLERDHVGAFGEEWAFSFLERIQIAGRSVLHYLQTFISPVWPQPLSFNYPRVVPSTAEGGDWLPPLLVAGAFVGLSLLTRWGRRGPFVLAAAAAGLLFPALGFVDVYPFRYAFVADHFSYHALAPLSLGLAALVVGLRPGLVRLGLAAGCLVFGLFLSQQRAEVFRGPEELWRATLEVHPESGLALNNLGLMRLGTGDLDEARSLLERAERVGLDRHRVLRHLAIVHSQARRFEDARRCAEEALALSPQDPESLVVLASALIDLKDPDGAIRHLEEARRRAPDHALAHEKLALAAWHQGRRERARKFARRAVELDPESATAWNLLGLLERRAGEDAAGREAFRRAVAILPERWDLRLNLVQAELALNAGSSAQEQITRIRELRGEQPDLPEFMLLEGQARWMMAPNSEPSTLQGLLRPEVRADLRAAARQQLVRGWQDRGRADRALSAARRLPETRVDIEVKRRRLEAGVLVMTGRVDEARTLFVSTLPPDERARADEAFARFRAVEEERNRHD